MYIGAKTVKKSRTATVKPHNPTSLTFFIFHVFFVDFSLTFRWLFVDFPLIFRWLFVDFSLIFRWFFVDFSLSSVSNASRSHPEGTIASDHTKKHSHNSLNSISRIKGITWIPPALTFFIYVLFICSFLQFLGQRKAPTLAGVGACEMFISCRYLHFVYSFFHLGLLPLLTMVQDR